MPGYVDADAHMWAPRGVHQRQVFQHLANLAYGVTTTPRSADLHRGRLRLPGPPGDRADPGPADLRHRPRDLLPLRGVRRGRRRRLPEALRRGLRRGHHQAVHRRRPHRPAVGGDGFDEAPAHPDHRGRPRSQAQPDPDGRRVSPATSTACRSSRSTTTWRSTWRGPTPTTRRRSWSPTAGPGARTTTSRTPTWWATISWPASSRPPSSTNMVRRRGQWFLPEEYVHEGISEGCMKVMRARGALRAGQPRPAPGARRPLGDLGAPVGRTHRARDPDRRHLLRSGGHRVPRGPGDARGREAGGHPDPRRRSPRGHPEHQPRSAS